MEEYVSLSKLPTIKDMVFAVKKLQVGTPVKVGVEWKKGVLHSVGRYKGDIVAYVRYEEQTLESMCFLPSIKVPRESLNLIGYEL